MNKKNFVLFGSSGSIARHVSHSLSKKGHRVIEFSSKDPDGARFDPTVSNENDLVDIINRRIGGIGHIDEVHYFCGVSDRDFGSDPFVKADDAMAIFSVNLIGLHIFLRNFSNRLSGGILFVYSSVRAFDPGRSIVYAASKAALNTYVKSIAIRYEEYKITCVNFILGPVDTNALTKLSITEKKLLTEKTSTGSLGNPAELADFIAKLPREPILNGTEIRLYSLK